MLDYKKNFTDRLQFLGVIGPFTLLLTLFCLLIRGGASGWYLFVATLAGLPLSWKWRTKGLLASLGFLALLLFSMYPFFEGGEKLWQTGASLSLGLGLFITFLGFEEIKGMISDLQLESQSRLDNLIALDDEIKSLKKDWDLSEEDYHSQIENKDLTITKLSDQADALEKSTSIIQDELKEIQTKNQNYVYELEKQFKSLSKLEISHQKITEELEENKRELSLSLTDRERKYCEENEALRGKLDQKESQIFDLEEKLQTLSEYESNLSHEAGENALNIQKMEEALREKVSQIYALQDSLKAREGDIHSQKEQLEGLAKKLTEKEHEMVSIRSQIAERDKKIDQITQSSRDLSQDLTLAKDEIKALGSEQSERIKSKNHEVEKLHQELEQKGAELSALKARNTDLDETLRMYEEKSIEQEEELDQKLAEKKEDLKLLNEARFALFQANLDKERLRKDIVGQKAAPQTPKELPQDRHWLLQLQSILKNSKRQKIQIEKLPKNLRNEIVTLNQSKALYSQLREQFDDKSKVLDEVREKLFKAESQVEKLKKERESEASKDLQFENELEKSLFVKDEEIKTAEQEVLSLNTLINELLEELNQEG